MNDKKISKRFNIIFAIIVTLLYLFDYAVIFLDLPINFFVTIPVFSLFLITILYYNIIRIKKYDFQESVNYLFKVLKILLFVCMGIGVVCGLLLFIFVSYKTSIGHFNTEFFGPLIGVFLQFFSASMILVIPLLFAFRCLETWLIIPLLKFLNKKKKIFYIIFGVLIGLLIVFKLSSIIFSEKEIPLKTAIQKSIYKNTSQQQIIYNDKLYYYDLDDEIQKFGYTVYDYAYKKDRLYVIDINGENNRLIAENPLLDNMHMIEIVNNYLYYTNEYTYKINLTSGEIIKVSEDYLIEYFLYANDKTYALLRVKEYNDNSNNKEFNTYYVLGEYNFDNDTYIEVNRTSSLRNFKNVLINEKTLDIYYYNNETNFIHKNKEALSYSTENLNSIYDIISINNNCLYFYNAKNIYCLNLSNQELFIMENDFKDDTGYLANSINYYFNDTYTYAYCDNFKSIYILNSKNNAFEKIITINQYESVKNIRFYEDNIYISLYESDDLIIYNSSTNRSEIKNNVYVTLKDNKSLYIVDNKDYTIKKITK